MSEVTEAQMDNAMATVIEPILLLNSPIGVQLAWLRIHGGSHYADAAMKRVDGLRAALAPAHRLISQKDLLKRARKCVEEWPTRRPEFKDDLQLWTLNLDSGDLDGCHADETLEEGITPLTDTRYSRGVCIAQRGVIYADRLPVTEFCEAMRLDMQRRNALEIEVTP